MRCRTRSPQRVYRVVQEGLTNIVKHAQRPTNVSVVIRRPDATLQVIIEDNGCGFDSARLGAKAGRHRGLGLDGMRERLSLIGGTLEVESAIGAGTTIFARIPLDGSKVGGRDTKPESCSPTTIPSFLTGLRNLASARKPISNWSARPRADWPR